MSQNRSLRTGEDAKNQYSSLGKLEWFDEAIKTLPLTESEQLIEHFNRGEIGYKDVKLAVMTKDMTDEEIQTYLSELEAEEAYQKRKYCYKVRDRVKDYALTNVWEMFVTLTLDPTIAKDRTDYASCKAELSKWLEKMRKKYGKFSYLAIPELHKDGKGIHWHILMSGINKLKHKKAKNKRTGKNLIVNGKQVYNLPQWNFGWSTMTFVGDQEATANYITKYITKQFFEVTVPKGQKRYLNSQDLEKPSKIYLGLTDEEVSDLTVNLDSKHKWSNTKVVNIETGEIIEVLDRENLIALENGEIEVIPATVKIYDHLKLDIERITELIGSVSNLLLNRYKSNRNEMSYYGK